ncbi:hypothetical protein [Haliscomenobacter sp.]|uniref:hypothetical protein n=1 Tax=Haliscomenobacter sp. TaxID=2717303 RepID=UPI00359315A6
MNHNKLSFLLLFILCACHGVETQNGIIPNEVFLSDTRDSTKTTQAILNKFIPSSLALAQADTSDTFFYGNNVIEEDSLFRQLLIGKMIDSANIHAVEIDLKDTMIQFFQLRHQAWKPMGNARINIPIYSIEFEDLNGDNKKEIITSTWRNMNGNSWKEVYCQSKKTGTIQYAGSFSTDYVVNKTKKQIEETYFGSWYIDPSLTLYEWRNEKLVPIKQLIIAHDRPVTENGKSTFEYYENASNDLKGLKLVFKEPYSEANQKQQQLWDDFFSKNK